MSVLSMTELDLAGKHVLIRQDLNVPIQDGVITSDVRIRASLKTILVALEAGATWLRLGSALFGVRSANVNHCTDITKND